MWRDLMLEEDLNDLIQSCEGEADDDADDEPIDDPGHEPDDTEPPF